MALLAPWCGDLRAAERLANIFADNMVLQRDIAAPVWGWAEKGQSVRVSFAGQEKTATADETGRWMLRLDPVPASKTPQQLTVVGATTQVVKNVLVGDVWICAGQSNMSWFLQDSTNGKSEIATASHPDLRFVRVSQTISPFPLQDNEPRLSWEACAPMRENMWMTAVGYFFARELMKEIDVPIGLIGANLGATCIETWIPISGFHGEPGLSGPVDQYRRFLTELKGWLATAEPALDAGRPLPAFSGDLMATADFQQPAKCFNGMIHPLIPFGLRGVIWYQGEGNGPEGEIYHQKMKALIGSWRTLWNQGGSTEAKSHDFPFYFVQLANFQKPNPENPGGAGETWARLREAQLKSLDIPNTGMAVTIDIGEVENVHPANKQDVGRRLALWALARDYGRKVVYSGPLYKSYAVEGDKIRITFDHVGDGLCVGTKNGVEPFAEEPSGTLRQFAIAGDDQKWRWADAAIVGDSVVVSHPEVPKPTAVRYAFALNPAGANLYNKAGLPASPFRTDDWP